MEPEQKLDQSLKTKNGLQFFMDSGSSTLQIDHYPKQKLLKMTLNIAEAKLFQGLSRHVLDKKESATNTWDVYMPIRISAGNYQTGEVWTKFNFEEIDGVGTGSDPYLVDY